MDTRTGIIYPYTELKKRFGKDPEAENFMREMLISPTEAQLKRKPPRVGRNEPCPCGSGKKFKKCCFVALQ